MIFNENFVRPRLFEGPFTPLLALFVVIDMVSIFATSFYSMPMVNLLLTVNPNVY